MVMFLIAVYVCVNLFHVHAGTCVCLDIFLRNKSPFIIAFLLCWDSWSAPIAIAWVWKFVYLEDATENSHGGI
jgi:hypothetical protein